MSGLGRSQALTLAPYETVRLGLRHLVTDLGLRGETGGLRLTVDGSMDALRAAEVLFDETTGFSAMMKVFPRDLADMAAARVLRAPMVALTQPDPALRFPSGTVFNPYLLLRNASGAPLASVLQLSWRSAAVGGVLSAPMNALGAGETRLVNLAKTPGLPRNATWAAVSISYNGTSGDLVAEAASFDATGRWGVQSPFSEGLAAKWRGSMWQVDSTHDTLLTAVNAGARAARVRVILSYNRGAGSYQIPDRISPARRANVGGCG